MIQALPKAKLIWITPKLEVQIRKLLKSVRKTRQSDVLHHVVASFCITVSRGMAHDIFKFAPNSIEEDLKYSQLSGNSKRECIFISPPNFTDEQLKIWFMTSQVSADHYIALLELGISAKAASSVLPNSLKTDIIVTGTIAEWLEWLYLPVLDTVASSIRESLMKHAPSLFEDLEPNEK